MNQPAGMCLKDFNFDIDNKIYSGMIDCASKMLKAEGPMSFYKGFTP